MISTAAGSGSGGFAGDGGTAAAAELNLPVFVATDPAGNFYVADQNNNRIRKVTASGQISTIAGTGSAGFSGDGGPAVSAELNSPSGVFFEPAGTILIADVGNQRLRRIDVSGNINTIAGNGAHGYSGDGGPALQATFYNAVRTVTDPAGNVFIADQSNHRVRRIDASGTVSTLAGTGAEGFSGDGGAAAAASLDNPTAVALDSAGNLYIADQFNHRIREVDTTGVITTIAGNGSAGFAGDGGPATSASFDYPGGLIIDTAGNIFVADDLNFRVREISASGTISTIAGNGTEGFAGDGGPATSAELDGQFGVAIDAAGNLLIADSANNRIRAVSGLSSVIPVFTSAAVTNGASFVGGGSAGALGSIFGSHLSVNFAGIVTATAIPLPLQLAGTSVTVNGVSAPVLAVANANGSEQINFQVPWEAAGQSTAQVVVTNALGSSAEVAVPLLAAQPGLFSIDGVNGAIEHLDGSVVTASNPAAAGETVVVFATGLGPVTPAIATGQAASNSPISYTSMTPSMTIGGLPATVLFSGEAPGFVGLNQLNVEVPAGSPSGSQDLALTVNDVGSNTVKIQVK